MALIKCKNCGHTISDKAVKCPSCGAKQTPVKVVTEPIITNNVTDNKPNAEVQSDKKKSSSKSVIIAVVLIIAVVIGGAVWFFIMTNGEPQQVTEDNITTESETVISEEETPNPQENTESDGQVTVNDFCCVEEIEIFGSMKPVLRQHSNEFVISALKNKGFTVKSTEKESCIGEDEEDVQVCTTVLEGTGDKRVTKVVVRDGFCWDVKIYFVSNNERDTFIHDLANMGVPISTIDNRMSITYNDGDDYQWYDDGFHGYIEDGIVEINDYTGP